MKTVSPTLITSNNVNGAFREAFWKLRTMGVPEESRNGPVLVMPGPVITTFLNPLQRVLFNPVRDANPVFHLMEAIWMLAGRDDVGFLLPFNSGYDSYAELDGTVHGAYGDRWRNAFGIDQIYAIIYMLKRDPKSRQAVMQMWSSAAEDCNDLVGEWKDRPCNTHIYFDRRYDQLNMTVCCRSNDVVWGAYGANIVHFSILQELIALALGVPIGAYCQMSNNFHAYTDLPVVKHFIESPPFEDCDAYTDVRGARPEPLLQPGERWEDFLSDCESFCDNEPTRCNFFENVAQPLRAAYVNRKAGDTEWRSFLRGVPKDNDWKIAFNEWVARRDGEKQRV